MDRQKDNMRQSSSGRKSIYASPNMTNATLLQTDLTEANLTDADLSGTDLTGVRGLNLDNA